MLHNLSSVSHGMGPILLLLCSFTGLAHSYLVPSEDVHVLRPRQPDTGPVLHSPRSPYPVALEKRAAETFDLGWQVQDQPLFSANWSGGTGNIPIGVTPFETSLAESFSLVLECLDCRTYGSIEATFNDGDDGGLLNATLTFNNVGAFMEFGVFSSSDGTFTIGLGRFFGNDNQTGALFSANIGFGIDLVLQFNGEVQASGGFQFAIPDGEQVGLGINFDVDVDEVLDPGFLDVSADINLFPRVDFSLLPIEISNAAANITAAIVLKAEAGISADVGAVSGDASVGANLALVQVSFGATVDAEAECERALFIDVESNGGAFAQLGASVPGQDFEIGPNVSTVFATAGTTTCLGQAAASTPPAFSSTRPPPPQTASDAAACPTALATKVQSTTKTYALTSCLVPAVNCPVSLTQVVQVANVEEATTVFCPLNATGGLAPAYPANRTAPAPATATETVTVTAIGSSGVLPPATAVATAAATATATATLSPSVTPVPFPTTGALTLPVMTAPVTAPPPPSFGNATTPRNATVSGIFESIPVPPPPPPPEATATAKRTASAGNETAAAGGNGTVPGAANGVDGGAPIAGAARFGVGIGRSSMVVAGAILWMALAL